MGRNQFKIQNDALYETLRERGLANATLTKFKIEELLPPLSQCPMPICLIYVPD
ncbi:MAG: hypothetical protein V7K14_15715 [Nostoc sp.]|uniref:hypothetical protein n=1 Tax=Nostoc sp. NMS7 TaxID=2815391 RepID=UPI0025CCB33F|nr:hypothetical protein [Nostoc sp. NMS7]MBN3951669.1 hypothetical protein [Nostoc sp. NMS7]